MAREHYYLKLYSNYFSIVVAVIFAISILTLAALSCQWEHRLYTETGSRIIYNRVPKCGSSSFLEIVQVASSFNDFTLHRSGEYMKFILSDHEKESMTSMLKLGGGRVFYERHYHYFDMSSYGMHVEHVNLIRDPLERMVSWYYYRRFQEGHRRDMTDTKRNMLIIRMTRLHEVLQQRRYRHLTTLLESGAEINTSDNKGRTLLMICCLREETGSIVKIFKQLISMGADVNIRDNSELDVLSHATQQCRTRIMDILLCETDAELRRTDSNGLTALHHAVITRNLIVVNLLVGYLKRFRLTLDDADVNGMTALMMARGQGSGEIARCLELAGASRTMRDDVRFWNSDQWSSSCIGHLLTAVVGITTPSDKEVKIRKRRRTKKNTRTEISLTYHHSKTRSRSAPIIANNMRSTHIHDDQDTPKLTYPRRLEDSHVISCAGNSHRQRAVSCPVGDVYYPQATPFPTPPPTYLDTLFGYYSQQCSQAYCTPAPPYIQPDHEESDETISDKSATHDVVDGARSRVQKVVERVKRADRVLRNVRRLLAGPTVHVTPPLDAVGAQCPSNNTTNTRINASHHDSHTQPPAVHSQVTPTNDASPYKRSSITNSPHSSSNCSIQTMNTVPTVCSSPIASPTTSIPTASSNTRNEPRLTPMPRE